MIIPVLLRCFLRPAVVRPNFLRAVSLYLEGNEGDIQSEGSEDGAMNQDPINFIVRTFVLLAESNTVLMSTREPDYSSVSDVVKAFRKRFQVLLRLSADSIGGRMSQTPASRASRASPASEVLDASEGDDHHDQDEEPQIAERGRAVKFRKMIDRPNVHNGLHYEDIAAEYGYPYNINVLIGEDMHRWTILFPFPCSLTFISR